MTNPAHPDYPIWPDPPWPGSDDEPPAPPPVGSYTLWWCDPKPKLGGGGVFKLDDELVAFATQPQTLSDRHEFFCDITAEAKEFSQLSPEGQVAATPPPPPLDL
jgi:hypothetical protein